MSRDFGNLTDAIQGAQGGETPWLREPYVGRVTIKSIKYSEDVPGYKKTPYFKYFIETRPADGESQKTEIILWRPIDSETEEKSFNKLKKIRGLYDSCGIDPQLKGQEYLEAILGKECNMVIQIQEKALLQAQPPKISNNPTYWFSKPLDEFIEITQDKLFWRLSEAELKQFHLASDKFNKEHPKAKEEKKIAPNEEFLTPPEEEF